MRRLFVGLFLLAALAWSAAAQDSPPVIVEQVERLGKGCATSAAWSEDSFQVAIGTTAGVWVYNRADRPTLVIETDYRVTWVEFSPAGGLLAVGLGDGTAQVFETAFGKLLDRVVGGPVPERGAMASYNVAARRAHFVPESATLGQTQEGMVSSMRVTDADGTKLRLKVIVFGDDVVQPEFVSPSGTTAIMLACDHVELINTATRAPFRELTGYGPPLVDIAFNTDGETILARRVDGAIVSLDADSDEWVSGTVELLETDTIFAASSVELMLVAIATDDGGITISDEINDTQIVLTPHTSAVTALAFDVSGSRLAAGYADGMLKLFNLHSGEVETRYAHFGHVEDIVWMFGDTRIVTAGEEGRLKAWALDRGVLGQGEIFGIHADEVTALAVSPDDPALFASASLDGTVKLWRLRK